MQDQTKDWVEAQGLTVPSYVRRAMEDKGATFAPIRVGEFGPVCRCGALIEEVDSGDGYTYWAHVKRMRIDYDHAAVPKPAE